MTEETKQERIGYLEEDVNIKSGMRLMCFLSLLFSMVSAVITLLFADVAVLPAGVFVTTIFVIGAFAPKAIQRLAENKLEEIMKK
jgi:ABC-type Mn2+/Zn2+ transport system permease subunit